MLCNIVSRISIGNHLVEERPVPLGKAVGNFYKKDVNTFVLGKDLLRRVQGFEIFKECPDVVAGIDKEWAPSFEIHRFNLFDLCVPKTSSECDAAMESPKLAG